MLTIRNIAIERELPFALKHNVDPSTISYHEKLSKYLSAILIDDELAQKVRETFDAYVFLSYWKKDKVAVQSLMRLIHQNDFARDIAIWYDAFLVPGENFNPYIEQKLRSSDLFVLAVIQIEADYFASISDRTDIENIAFCDGIDLIQEAACLLLGQGLAHSSDIGWTGLAQHVQ